MRRTLPALALVLLPALAPAFAAAQATPVPKRPKLEAASLDSNDARVYYQLGLTKLRKFPEEAADAFWWAARLDPSWADPLYARRVAVLMSEPTLLDGLMEEKDRIVASPEMRRLDSLQLRALSLNPFLHGKLDYELFLRYFANTESGADRVAVESAMEDWLKGRAGPGFRAWVALSQGRFPDAVKNYQAALDRARDRAAVHAGLAEAYFLMGDRPRALEQLSSAVGELRQKDEKRIVHVYESKAIYEHAAGLVHELNNAPDSAKAAYGRALQEDLAYWPAHRQLGQLLLATGDTAGAIAELDQAVQLKGDDAALRYSYGFVLTAANKLEEAVEQFRKATEIDPDYPAPYVLLGRIYDAAGYAPQAREYNTAFLAHAPKRDSQVPRVTQRLQALAAAPADTAARKP